MPKPTPALIEACGGNPDVAARALALADTRPWGSGDPITWAVNSGRLAPTSGPEWRGYLGSTPELALPLLAVLEPALDVRDGANDLPVVAGDPAAYASNPLVDDAITKYPSLRGAAGAPTLFATGNLPLVTACGADPHILASLPWRVRHPAAAAPTRHEVYQLAETFTDGLDGSADRGIDFHPGNNAYRSRVERWIALHMSDDDMFAASHGPKALAAAKAKEKAERDALAEHLRIQRAAIDDRLSQLS